MALNTFQGLMRSYGGAAKESGVTPSPLTMAVVISFDPTSASATAVRIGTSSSTGRFFTLPAGAVPLYLLSLGGATGGTNPTVDIGSSGTPDGFFNEADADTKGTLNGANGSLVVGTGIAAQTQVFGRVGASAASGGTFTGVFVYTMYNDGSVDS
jgi:hypothetical protein